MLYLSVGALPGHVGLREEKVAQTTDALTRAIAALRLAVRHRVGNAARERSLFNHFIKPRTGLSLEEEEGCTSHHRPAPEPAAGAHVADLFCLGRISGSGRVAYSRRSKNRFEAAGVWRDRFLAARRHVACSSLINASSVFATIIDRARSSDTTARITCGTGKRRPSCRRSPARITPGQTTQRAPALHLRADPRDKGGMATTATTLSIRAGAR